MEIKLEPDLENYIVITGNVAPLSKPGMTDVYVVTRFATLEEAMDFKDLMSSRSIPHIIKAYDPAGIEIVD